ncbi:hypothetical protein ACFQZE_19410 [Paenibacillus sp. GCM10027627]|uniref:hypothetical protein n=1 Tax=unclassified Paenibacillus TaxID=185978 RepID=UPI00362EA8B0
MYKQMEIYGPYNCTMNAVSLFLVKNNINIDDIYRYNFDIHCSFEEKKISGAISIPDLFQYVKKNYGYEVREIEIEDVTVHQYAVVNVDVFYIPGNSYYNVHHSGHNMLAYWKADDTVDLLDPYFKIEQNLTKEEFTKVFRKGEPVYTFFKTGEPLKLSENRLPCIAGKSASDCYKQAESELRAILTSIAEKQETEFTVDAFFGCLRTVEIARDNYFRNVNADQDQANKVMVGWKKVLMYYVRMKNNPKFLNDLMKEVNEVFEHEMAYLESLQEVECS